MAFNFDLQTDVDGNFYYAKSGHGSDFELPGAVWKISPDGKYREVVCTGFRSPNGLGSMPGRITVSDNQGQWIPASKISLTKPGSFVRVGSQPIHRLGNGLPWRQDRHQCHHATRNL